MKTLMLLKSMKKYFGSSQVLIQTQIDEAIEELKSLQKEKDLLEEYVQFARTHIETYRCKCGSLGRVGYLCSNKECSKD